MCDSGLREGSCRLACGTGTASTGVSVHNTRSTRTLLVLPLALALLVPGALLTQGVAAPRVSHTVALPNAQAKKPKAEAVSRNVSGTGFRKTFTASELSDIKAKRREMRERLFAAG